MESSVVGVTDVVVWLNGRDIDAVDGYSVNEPHTDWLYLQV